MKTVIRNSYTPVVGDYCEKIVIDLETRSAYLFDCDGVFTPFSNVDAAEIIEAAVTEANAYTDDVAETKVDKEEGKGLSTNDFTNSYKDRLDGIEEGAQVNVIESVSVNGTTLPVSGKNVDISVPTKTSDIQNDSGFITKDVNDLTNYYTAVQTDDVVRGEADARQLADADLQSQIDAIVSSSDVVDIVGTYAELQAYDTSHLSDKDIIKVLTDETHGDATSYFRFDKPNNTWTYIGSEGPFYTKSESDSTFVPLTRTVNNKPLSSNITLTAADVGALPDSTVIPTVNDATLTIQKNGSTVTTFTANSATNTTANISVPVKTSDITNDGSDGTSTYVEADDLATVATSGSYNDLLNKPTIYDPEDFYWANVKVSDQSATNTAPSFGYIKLTRTNTYPHIGGDGTYLAMSADGQWGQGHGSIALRADSLYPSTTESGRINLGASSSLWKDIYLSGAIYHGSYKLTLPNQAGTVALTSDIPTVNDATLTIQKNGTTIDTFTANSATNKTVNVAVPVNTSDLTNDSGFIDNTVSNLTNYYDQTAINGMFNALPAVPTKTSDLTNDSGFVSNTDYASANTAGVIKVGNNLSIDANGVLSATGTTSLDWANITNKPTNVSYWTNDAGYITSAALPTKTSDLTNDSGFITSASLPTKTSDLTNDSGFITNSVNNLTNYYKKSDTYTQAEVNSLINALPPVPTKTSDLVNDGEDGTAEYLEDDETAYQTASIPYGACDSTSTSTVFTATVPGITELRDGVCMWLKNGVVTSASGFTININNLGAKPVYSNMAAATAETTMFNVNYTMFFVYDSTRVTGGCWVLYRGYNANDNTIGYQVRTNSQSLPASDAFVRYRLLFTSADGTKYVPATTSTSTNATASRTVNQTKINPFGRIFYYGSTTAISAGSRPAANTLWEQYAISLGYSFNRTGAALTLTSWKPVYMKCAPQTDGSAIIDSTTPYVQDLPTTDDGKIYVFLGVAYSATNIELQLDHPVYCYKDGMIRPYTNPAAQSITVDSALSTSSENPVQNKVITGALDDKTNKATFFNNTAAVIYKKVTIAGGSDSSDGVGALIFGRNQVFTLNGMANSGYQGILYEIGTSYNNNAVSTSNRYIHLKVVGTSNNTTTSIYVGMDAYTYCNIHSAGVITVTDSDSTEYDGATANVSYYSIPRSGSAGDKVKYTSYNISPSSDTTAAWKTALGNDGTYFTWYNTASKFTNQPSQYGFLRTIIGANDIRQDWWTQTGGSHYYRTGNGTGWYGTSGNAGAFRDITVNNGTLTIQKNGTNVQTFTANQSSNVTANITVPTNLSDLYNDMGFASYSAGDHIDITNGVISAVDYVHSENPVAVTSSTPTVTSGMIADGAITASKLAAGVNLTLTLSTTDIGEGAALAANTLYGVYQ